MPIDRPNPPFADGVTLPPLVRAEDGAPARWPTIVRLAHDGDALFVRFECRDQHRWATLDQRDAPLWQEEVVEVFIAPGPEVPGRYLEFEVNPLGALFDAVVDNPDGRRDTMRVDTSWDCPGIGWRAGQLDDAEDWWAELVLPFRSLLHGVDRDAETIPAVWRVNCLRVERPRDQEPEFSAWSPTGLRPADFHVPDRFGFLVLDGLADADELLPTDAERPCVVVPRIDG